MAKRYTPTSAAADVEAALRLLEGRWKLVILFHLFGGKVMRFSDLERAIPNITQKMLGQQLRTMEADGIVVRTAYPQVPPKVEYHLTPWGQSLCPALDAILKWADRRGPHKGESATRAEGMNIPPLAIYAVPNGEKAVEAVVLERSEGTLDPES
jgi:DNA-binding HxlR family transcriptional regulator